MTKRFIGTDVSGRVLHGKPNLALVAIMTSGGGLIPAEKVEYEISKHVNGGVPEPVARAFIEGVAFGGLTENEAIGRIAAKDMPEAVAVSVVDFKGLPSSKMFFDAWEEKAGGVAVNMAKARPIKTDQLRPERDKRLADEDVAYMRADEAGDTAEKARIAARKQALRNLPITIQPELDLIDTPEALAAWQPTWPE